MTPEQQGLLDKALRSLQAARGLNATGFAEFAASRAYYAMFYVAEAFLASTARSPAPTPVGVRMNRKSGLSG